MESIRWKKIDVQNGAENENLGKTGIVCDKGISKFHR